MGDEPSDQSSMDSRSRQADALFMRGHLCFEQNQFTNAYTCWQKSLEIYQELDLPQAEGALLSNLALVCELLGEYSSALSYLQQSIEITQTINDVVGWGQAVLNLANLHCNLGQYSQAQKLYQQALEIALLSDDQRLQVSALCNLGSIYTILSDYEQAVEHLQDGLKLAQQLRLQQDQANILGNLAQIEYLTEAFESSIEHQQQSLDLKLQLNDQRGVVHSLGKLGLVYGELGNYEIAVDYHEQSLSLSRQIQYYLGEIDCLKNLGRTFLKARGFAKAEEYLREAVLLGETLRQRLNIQDAQKLSFFETQDFTYRSLQIALVDQDKTEEALIISEQAHACILTEVLGQQSPHRQTSPLAFQQMLQISTELNATLVEYSIIYDEYRIDQKLETKESRLLIWVLSPDGQYNFRQVDLSAMWEQDGQSINDRIARLQQSVNLGRDAVSVENPPHVATFSTELQRLYSILIQPIIDLLPKDSEQLVIMIPHESLFLVPFAALQSETGNCLIERHTLAVSLSIQMLHLTTQRSKKLKPSLTSSLVIGNPVMPEVVLAGKSLAQTLCSLPGAEQEAISISQILGTEAIIGAAATKAYALSMLSTAKVIHFATHGLLSYLVDQTIPGAIALTASESDNGLLYSSEILQFQLGAELAVLSACNTAQGTLTGDGVVGLAYAFIMAGVSSVIVSLWSIPDSPTVFLMTQFYQYLSEGHSKSVALRRAILDAKQQHSPPVNWGAFLVLGNPI